MATKTDKVVSLASSRAVKVYGTDVITEKVKITPRIAAKWLEQNHRNRPIRKMHVKFLADEMALGHWRLNGETIKIASTEDILDGQHRLMACIESGVTFESLVVYGVDPEAFSTIDTGAVRSGGDALALHFPDVPTDAAKSASAAVTYLNQMNTGWTTKEARRKISNTEGIETVIERPEILRAAELVHRMRRSAIRPLSKSAAVAFVVHAGTKNWDQAEQFIRDVWLGEELGASDPVYWYREFCQAELKKTSSTRQLVRLQMVMKAWNLRRRGKTCRSYRALMLKPDEQAPKLL